MPHLMAIGTEHFAFFYLCQKPFPRFVYYLIADIKLFFDFVAVVKVKDASVSAVVFNPTILALPTFHQNQLDLPLSVVLLLVFLPRSPVTMIPFAFVLSRVIVFSAIVSVDVTLRPAILVVIFGFLATTARTLNQFGLFIRFVEIPLLDLKFG